MQKLILNEHVVTLMIDIDDVTTQEVTKYYCEVRRPQDPLAITGPLFDTPRLAYEWAFHLLTGEAL